MKVKTRSGERTARDAPATTYVVLGGDHVGAAIARLLRDDGHSVRFVDDAQDPADIRALEAAGLSETSAVVVATASDSRNLLLAQLARAHFDVAETHVLVNAPDRHDAVAEAGHAPICATTALSRTTVDALANASIELEQTE